MLLDELRDLDGPNLFLLEPAIKVELIAESEADLRLAAVRLGGADDAAPFASFHTAAVRTLGALHRAADLPAPAVVARRLDDPGHVAVAFGWRHRRLAVEIGRRLAAIAAGSETSDEASAALRGALEVMRDPDPGDAPLMIRDSERCMPVVAITGTNGKTTTTRLLAHILMNAGRHAGWSSSSGVYIDGRPVLEGDYSGPSGARRVLQDPGVDVAVLETARGGILLRGIACESNDVSVFTNVSADHLDLQGVRTVETLAEVKAVVCRVTKPGGLVVVNACDPLVMAATEGVRAERLLFSSECDHPVVEEHIVLGGQAIVPEGGALVHHTGFDAAPFVRVDEIPMTFGGRAVHMVENAMAAAGAAIGLGLELPAIGDGLRSFHNSPELNLGRLNVFERDGVTIIMDFAHNEVGLELLLEFARRWLGRGGRITSIIGTAGDRTAHSLQELGRIGARGSDRVIIKETVKYGRGRSTDEMTALYQAGVHAAGRADAEVAPGELEALDLALDGARPGDVIAFMCQEQMEAIGARLSSEGRPLS